jgi:hypothetical protein
LDQLIPVLGDRATIWSAISKLRSGLVYSCFICKSGFSVLKLLSDHLKDFHKVSSSSSHECVHCGSFYERKQYLLHLRNVFKIHRQLLEDNNIDIVPFDTESVVSFLGQNNDIPLQNKELNLGQDDQSFQNELSEIITKLIAGILSSGKVPMSTKDNILELFRKFTERLLQEVVNRTTDIIKSDESVSEKVRQVSSIIKFSEVFSKFDTKHKLDKYLLNKNMLVPVKEIVLDSDIHFPLRQGIQRQVYSPIKMQYVPIHDSILQLLQKPGFFEMLDKQTSYSGKRFSSFRDGKFFRDGNFPSQIIFINVYFDEAEVANPLGSKSGKHKLANFYFSIQDMPRHYNSSIHNIILLCSLKSNDLKILSANTVLNVIVSELLDLWKNGINFINAGQQMNVKVALSQLSGDNLGIHTILGFSEGFNANFPCRRCKMKKSECQVAIQEDHSRIRTITDYNNDILVGNLSLTGINFESVLNKLPYHHVTNMVVFDIMHDLLEGVIPDLLNLVLNLYISKKYFDLDKINYRLESFDYGRHFRKSRPSQIKTSVLKGDTKSGQNASQNLCLVVSLPLILGDLVPANDNAWNLVLLIREVLDIVLCDTISKGGLIYLDSLVSEYCSTYQSVFKKKLKPKHHHLIHYSGAIKQIGTLKQYWSMTFEARHKLFKTTAHAVCNFINIPKTLAYRHQLSRCYSLLATDNFSPFTFTLPQYEFKKLSEYSYGDILASYFNISIESVIKISNLIEWNNSEFRTGSFVVLKYCINFPEFGLILGIVVNEEECCLIVSEFSSLFVSHLCSYKITKCNVIKVVNLDSIDHYQPLYTMKSFYDNDINDYISIPFKRV